MERELKIGFLDEAEQMLGDAEQCFLEIETRKDDPTVIDRIFRLAHNIKGTSRAVGFNGLADFTHELESLLLKIKSREIEVTRPIVGLLLKCNDHLQTSVVILRNNLDAEIDHSSLAQEVREADAFSGLDAVVAESFQGAQPEQPARSVPRAAAPVPPAHEAEPPGAADGSNSSSRASGGGSIRVDLGRLERLMNNVGELVILQTVLTQQKHMIPSPLLQKTIGQLGKITKDIQDVSMSLRMVPVKQTFQKLQRVVRDTSVALGKQVSLHVSGEDSELDKTVLDHLGDPLVHLVRNAVDHGLEDSAGRTAAGKPVQGNLWLSASHQGGNLVIEVRDDGRGLDPERLKAKAIEKGILPEGATLSDREAYHLIFAPGFSTKSEVTDISGRGVGLDVVKTNVEKLQGQIQIETSLGKGTTFRVLLPLTLAIIDGMVVRSGEERYVIPIVQVQESLEPTREDVSSISGIGEVLNLRDKTIPLQRLGAVLGRTTDSRPAWESIAIVAHDRERPFALLVDEILGQQQVVIKRLGGEINNLRGISGGAILGDGRAALIVDIHELIHRKEAA